MKIIQNYMLYIKYARHEKLAKIKLGCHKAEYNSRSLHCKSTNINTMKLKIILMSQHVLFLEIATQDMIKKTVEKISSWQCCVLRLYNFINFHKNQHTADSQLSVIMKRTENRDGYFKTAWQKVVLWMVCNFSFTVDSTCIHNTSVQQQSGSSCCTIQANNSFSKLTSN